MRTRWARRGYAAGPYGQVHFRHAGEGGAPVVLLHQAPMTAAQFDNVYEPLAARGFHAIGIDMPGFGMSDPVDGVPRVEDWAACVPRCSMCWGTRARLCSATTPARWWRPRRRSSSRPASPQ
ncbi:alpha/beta fold hydrolase [Novosphingobium resinovorum]